jgi:two-component system NtrC family sensor kinase
MLPRTIYNHLRGHPFACGPLLGSRSQPVGAIGMSWYQGNKPIPDELFERGLLRAFMNHLGIAMERAANVARLERLNAELLKAQAAIESSARTKAVGELATAVAHDLNNLSGIALLAVSVGMQSPQDAYVVLPRIERANRMIGDLVGRLQRVARDAHGAGAAVDVACAHQITEDMVAMLGPMLRERAIAVEVSLKPAPAVRAEPTFVHQLLLNLLLNAQDALENVSGPRRLQISLQPDGDYVRLEVSDNGPGIAAEVMPRLFEPFVTTKHDGHAGLGLAASAAALKHLGGTIVGQNQAEGGALFSVTLPAAGTSAKRTAEIPAPSAQRGSVLAIDDDEDILAVVRAFLDTLGFDVITMTDSDAVLEVVATRTIDVVLCDVGMPKRNGLELAQLLRESGYRGKLVLMTGWDSERVEVDERAKACDLLLKKPFLGAELIHAIDKLLTPD